MLKKHFSTNLPKLEEQGHSFIYFLTEDSILSLSDDFTYTLLTIPSHSHPEVTMTHGRLPEPLVGKYQIPGYGSWFDCMAAAAIVYTSLADGCVKMFDLAANELIEAVSIPEACRPVAEGFDSHFVRYDDVSKQIVACYQTDGDLQVICGHVERKEFENIGHMAMPLQNAGGLIVQRSKFGIVFGVQVFDTEIFELGVIQCSKMIKVRFPLSQGILVVSAALVADSTLVVLFNEADDRYGSMILNLKCAEAIGLNTYHFSSTNEGLTKVALGHTSSAKGTLTGELFYNPEHNDLWYGLYGSIHNSKLIRSEGQLKFYSGKPLELNQSYKEDCDYYFSSALKGTSFAELTIDFNTGHMEGTIYQAACLRTQYYWILSQICSQNELMPTDIMEIIDLLV